MNKKNNKGFSLIEVIIAMALIAIIATTLAGAYSYFQARSVKTGQNRLTREQIVGGLDTRIYSSSPVPDTTIPENDAYTVVDARVSMDTSQFGVSDEVIDSKVIQQEFEVDGKTKKMTIFVKGA